jgi:hypothetical protein
MNSEEFIKELSKLRPGATFLALKGYRNEYSEVADYSIIFHMDYLAALRRSIVTLEAMNLPAASLDNYAKEELLASWRKSLENTKPVERREDHYTHFKTANGSYIKGVKVHTKTDTVHLFGLVVWKKVTLPGNYPTDTRRELTIAKDNLALKTSVGKFRQFKILPAQVNSISVDGIHLLPPE